MGLGKVVELLLANLESHSICMHSEAVHGCVSALSGHQATPRLVYIAAQLTQLLVRLGGGAGSLHHKTTPATVMCLARWARGDEQALSGAISHLLLLSPIGSGVNACVLAFLL